MVGLVLMSSRIVEDDQGPARSTRYAFRKLRCLEVGSCRPARVRQA